MPLLEKTIARKVGLLGGSFNPAHAGHVYISEQAILLLGLDEVWWLVSSQNPLKNTSDMASFASRLVKAKEVASSCRKIIVSDFEANANITYTFDTIRTIKAQYPHDFVWLMGADNLIQFPKWYKWQDIIHSIPIAVFNRDNLKKEALSCDVAREFKAHNIKDPKLLVTTRAPAWTFLDITTHPLSSTKIRNNQL